MNKVVAGAAEAVADIPDGATILPSVFAVRRSTGSDSATGPGRSVLNSANARCTASGIARPSRIVSASRATGLKQSIWLGTS